MSDGGGLIYNRLIVGGLQGLHVVAALTDATSSLRTGEDHDHITAHFGYLSLDRILGALADSEHGNHGSHADDNSQHSEEASHLVVVQSLYGYF